MGTREHTSTATSNTTLETHLQPIFSNLDYHRLSSLLTTIDYRVYWGGGQWPSGLERLTGDRVVLSSNPAAATSLRNFGNSVYPASIWCLCQGK